MILTPLKYHAKKHSSSTKNENFCGIIDNVATLYIDISDTSYLVNRSFGVQLFFLITTLFMVTLTSIFLLAVTLTKAAYSSLENVITFTTWAISNNVQMICIVRHTSNLCAEVSKSYLLVIITTHKFLYSHKVCNKCWKCWKW